MPTVTWSITSRVFLLGVMVLWAGSVSPASDHAIMRPAAKMKVPQANSPTPTPWPQQFHSTLFQNRSGKLALVDLYYDWPGGRNLNIIRSQQGFTGTLYDVEYTNRTSFYFDRAKGTCRTIVFPVGILIPNWLEGAEYLGTEVVDNRTTLVFTKSNFITYYEDEKTHQPVRWIFLESSAQFEVMSWIEGDVAPEAEWQAPASCFPLAGRQAEGMERSTFLGLR